MSDQDGGRAVGPGGGTVDDDGPVTLRAGVLVLWIEAALLGGLLLFELFKLVTGDPANPGRAAVLAAIIGGAALLLAQLGRLLVRRTAWARGPAIVLQLMALPVAFYMVTGEGGVLTRISGVVIGLIALLGAGLLLAPASRAALTLR